ncbi:MAG TPA: hypothetical protein VMM78_16570 [Thermomicrobiales bacterium]|nr:hypothetical protein [Thermomicrobiales bacterium]
MTGPAFRYSAWDGTRTVEALTPEQVLTALSDALLSGDIEQALDRALHRGLGNVDGEPTAGMDQLRDLLRSERATLDEELARDDSLRDLIDALFAAAGDASVLDRESSRLLDALAARPDAARIVAGLPTARLDLPEGAIRQRAGAQSPPGAEGGMASRDFSGWLDGMRARRDDIDILEQQLRTVRRVQDVESIDATLVQSVLGSPAAEQLERLAVSLRAFAESGFVRAEGRTQQLSARALQLIGDELLSEALRRLSSRGAGDHRLTRRGHHELTGSSRDYEFGDALALDLSRTVMRAIRRGGGVPVRVAADDFTIFERDDSARAATVLALDLSRSMGERGYLLAAKKLALAILTLVRTRFPRDQMRLASFSDTARPLLPRELPGVTWDRFGLGTNVQDALRLGRVLLAPHRGMQRNVLLLTDGEPTAHRDAAGAVHFAHPTTEETLAQTYAEADRLRRDGISLCVCVLSADMQVVKFAEQLARSAAGDLIVTAPDDLACALVLAYGASRR